MLQYQTTLYKINNLQLMYLLNHINFIIIYFYKSVYHKTDSVHTKNNLCVHTVLIVMNCLSHSLK